jgi:hypothetical protein
MSAEELVPSALAPTESPQPSLTLAQPERRSWVFPYEGAVVFDQERYAKALEVVEAARRTIVQERPGARFTIDVMQLGHYCRAVAAFDEVTEPGQ